MQLDGIWKRRRVRLSARPAGVNMIEGGRMRWERAVNITRILLHVIFAALGFAFVLRRRHR